MLFKGGSVLEPPLSQMQLTDKPAKSRAVSPSKTRLQLTGRSRSVINAAPSLPHCGVRGHCVTRRRARRDRRGIRREINRHFRALKSPRRFSGSTGWVKFRFGKQNLLVHRPPQRTRDISGMFLFASRPAMFRSVTAGGFRPRVNLSTRTQRLPSRQAGRGGQAARQARGGSCWRRRAQSPLMRRPPGRGLGPQDGARGRDGARAAPRRAGR